MVQKLNLLGAKTDQQTFLETAPIIGRVLDLPENGYMLVKYGSGPSLRARMVAGLVGKKREQLIGQEVVLLFENNNPEKPIAIASLAPTGDFASALQAANLEDEVQAKVDGETVLIQAKQKLELRVGKASIVIDANGKITIKGASLLSRSTGPIRIKGGHVDIN